MTTKSDLSAADAPDMAEALDAAGVGIWSWNFQRRGVLLSLEAAKLLGTGRIEVSEGEFLDLVHQGDRHAMEQSLADGLRTGKLHDIDFRTAKDGLWRRMRGQARADDGLGHGILLDIANRR